MWKILLLFLFCVSASGRIIIIERDSKTVDVTNLNGIPLRIAYFEIGQAMKKGNSETKITGIYGDIWNTLGEYLNFTLVGQRLDTKQYPGQDEFTVMIQFLVEQKCDVVPYVSGGADKRVDYGLPFFTFKQQILVRPVLKTNEKWLFTLIDYEIWFVLGTFLVLIAMIGWVSDRFLVPKILRLTMGDQLFYNFSTLCIQGMQSNSFANRFKILFITRCILVFLFWGYFSTFLYAQLTVKIPVEPFRDVQELLEGTDIRILAVPRFFNNGPLKSMLDRPAYKERIEFSTTYRIAFDKMCLLDEGKYAILAVDKIRAGLKLQCDVRKTGEDVSNTKILVAVRKGFQYKRSIDIGILKLKESGLLNRIHDHWEPKIIPSPSNSEVEPLSLSHFKYVFGVWALGMILSFVMFVGEVIVWDLKEKKKEKERKIRLERTKNIKLYPFVL